MQQTTSRVEGGRLYQPEGSGAPIVVETSAWFDWLEQHTAFTFVDRILGSFLAQKRCSASGELAWEASLTRAGQRYRVVLGRSETLTLSKLQSVAQTLASPHIPAEWAERSPEEPAAFPSLAPTPTVRVSPRASLPRTKLYRPRSGSDVIPRTRLIERLNEGLSGNVTLVSSPAGFGKTTLLAEWLQTIDRPSAWLSLDKHDNELPVFIHSLAAALQSVFPDAFQATASLLSAPHLPPPDHVVSLLINDLADVPGDIVLVLDDYHLIHSSEVHALLEQLIEQRPSQLHLVLATRADPPLPLVRWLTRGYLNELRAADLYFTLSETEAFLTRVVGQDVKHETAVALEEQTGGWIALVRLAAISMRKTANRAAFLERLAHSPDHTISGYLVEEVLDQLTPAQREVLVRASMLEQFCAELCVAVMGTDASNAQVQAILDWLEGSNLFLVPLDERHGWYRLPLLFQRLLQHHLRKHASAEEIAALHRRASAWYAAQGLIDEALGHALAAGDVSGAAHLVETHFLGAVEQEQWMLMERWLRLVPEEQIQSSPGLLLARALVLQARGQLEDFQRVLLAAERLLATKGSGVRDQGDPQSRLLHALIAISWSNIQYLTGQIQASLESGRSALKWTPPGEAHLASYAMQCLSLSLQATGQEEIALFELQQALLAAPARPVITARLLLAQGFVLLTAAKLPQLEYTVRHLLQLAQEAYLAISQNWAHWFLGVVSYEWNNLEAAVYHFSAVIANRHCAAFRAVQEALCGLALAYHAQGLDKEAQETTNDLLDWVQEEHNLSQLLTAYTFCGHLALVQDEVEKAEHWLELAGEQEVRGPMIFFEDPAVTRAWLLLATGDAQSVTQGQALLTSLLQHVETIHNTRKTIQVLALQAWAYDLQRREAEALDVLERALVLAQPAGFLRTFADVPQLAKLLQKLRKRRKTQQVVDKQMEAYLQRILVAMRPLPPQGGSTEALLQQEGLESLTERELQTLRLLDKDLSNKEIAGEMVVTPGTVKVYTNNLYRKLNVNNRRAAVTLAKTLGLLAANR